MLDISVQNILKKKKSVTLLHWLHHLLKGRKRKTEEEQTDTSLQNRKLTYCFPWTIPSEPQSVSVYDTKCKPLLDWTEVNHLQPSNCPGKVTEHCKHCQNAWQAADCMCSTVFCLISSSLTFWFTLFMLRLGCDSEYVDVSFVFIR